MGIGGFNIFPDSAISVFDTIANIIDWFKNIKENMYQLSLDLLSWAYETLNFFILQTPIWLFDNTWFEDKTHLISIVSVCIVMILTILEGIRKIIKHKNPLDLKTISKRFFIVSGISTLIPPLFKYTFKGLNWMSQNIIALGGVNITNTIDYDITPADVFILLGFDLTLIGLMIPLLLQTGKRFFDITALGVLSPLALTAWIFDNHKHLFNDWWSSLKRKSLHQITYAFFLLIIGMVTFGTGTPDTTKDMFVKLLVTVGGFYSMLYPPSIVKRYFDNSGSVEDFKRMGDKLKGNFKKGKSIVKTPFGWVKSIASIGKPQVISHKSRMSRIHGR